MLGGFDSSNNDGMKRLSSVECLKEVHSTWHAIKMHDMPEVISRHTAVKNKQFIYVFGGLHYDGVNKGSSKSTFVYNTAIQK